MGKWLMRRDDGGGHTATSWVQERQEDGGLFSITLGGGKLQAIYQLQQFRPQCHCDPSKFPLRLCDAITK